MVKRYPGTRPLYGRAGRGISLLVTLFLSHSLIAQLPAVSSFSPASGAVGSTVTITGNNFNATPVNNIVYFGAVRATVTAASTTSLTVTVPAGGSFQPLTVTTAGLTAYASQPFITTFSDTGQFKPTAFADTIQVSTDAGPSGVVSADLDGDGKPDLAVVNSTGNNLQAYLNTSTTGKVSFSLQYNTVVAQYAMPSGVIAGDLDGDGKLDLVVSNVGISTISIYKNTSTPGNISFATPIPYNTGGYPVNPVIIDLNGDGKPEIVTPNYFDNAISIYANNSTSGNLTFAAKQDIPIASPGTPYYVTVGDLDGDGKPEMVSVNYNGNNVSVFRNTSATGGAISFDASVDFPTANFPITVAIGDIDGDGKPDLVTANNDDPGSISLLHNTSTPGTLSFDANQDVAAGSYPLGLAIGDLDGDGLPDITITNTNDNNVAVYKNTSVSGSLSLAAPALYNTDAYPGYMFIADVNKDGMPDMITSNSTGNSMTVLTNKGSQEPAITSFSPVIGLSGTVVTITGVNLGGATAVSFGGTPASSFTVVSPTSVQATVAGGATGAVTVTTGGGIASLNGYTYGQPPPHIISFTPASAGTGAAITIKGSGFSSATAVRFGSTAAAQFVIQNDSTIVATIGAGATGNVSIVSPYGSASEPTFTYIPPPLKVLSFSPALGTTGALITIKGQSLSAVTTVSFGGTAAQSFTIQSDSVITAYVGAGASGNVSITDPSGTDALAGFTFVPPPPTIVYQINSFNPTSGKKGATITIKGLSFTGATTVSFGGVPASTFNVLNDTVITAVVAQGGTGLVQVSGAGWQDAMGGFTFIQDTTKQDSTQTGPPPPPPAFQLLQFSVALKGNTPDLQWVARNDKSIAYYIVERGVDTSQFSALTSLQPTVKDAGNHSYTFLDPAPRTGINYYKLQIQDTAGHLTYSHIVSVKASAISKALSIYPNPVKYGFIMIDLPSTARSSGIWISDMLGKVVKTQTIPQGTPQTRIDIPDLIRGTYKVVWSDGQNYSYQTILVL